MPLKKSKGNMYPWVTHTHAHLGGECPHKCSYCYVDHPRFGRPIKFQGRLLLLPNELNVPYGEGKTIFVDHCNDLWAWDVPNHMKMAVLGHCNKWPKNKYVFQTKNPSGYHFFRDSMPPDVLLGCTIETNRDIPEEISLAPSPISRCNYIRALSHTHYVFVTIEPIMDFDLIVLLGWLLSIRPKFVNIGADSKGHNLPEPPPGKVRALIDDLTKHNIEIREKHNLTRLLS